MYVARIDYHYTGRWNEILARCVEVFGLPGDRYITAANVDFMDFKFSDEQDRLLFLTGWPAYVPKDSE